MKAIIKGLGDNPYEICELNIRPTKNLEIIIKEVKVRKPRKCTHCHNFIDKGEKALTFYQFMTNREPIYHTFCSDCYQKIS